MDLVDGVFQLRTSEREVQGFLSKVPREYLEGEERNDPMGSRSQTTHMAFALSDSAARCGGRGKSY